MIEVMISILLTAIAVIGIVALYTTETRSSGFSRHNTEAAVLAEDKMEFLRTQIGLATGSGSETGLNESAGAAGMFSRTWIITTGTSWVDYSVTVGWNEDGVARSVTLRSRRGL
jgi:hypothetical protein